MISTYLLAIVFIFLKFVYSYDYYNEDVEIEIPANDDPRLSAPWVASIFSKNDDGQWKYHCGGTLINSYIVMTAASCVSSPIDDKNDVLYHTNYTNLMVIVGLRNINNECQPLDDEHTQFANISLIREHKPPQSVNSSARAQIYESPANLAAILLAKEFNYTDYVQPVQISRGAIAKWEGKILEGEFATIAGFNINPGLQRKKDEEFHLQVYNLSTSIDSDCVVGYKQHTNYFNVACGHIPGETTMSIPCFMEGAGLVGFIPETGFIGLSIPYLMGLYTSNSATLLVNHVRDPYPLSQIAANTQCTQSDVIFFTRLGEYFRWVTSHSFCGAGMAQCQDGECYQPKEICNGFAICYDKSDESKEVCKNQKKCDLKKEFQCDYGVCIAKEKYCDGKPDCADDSDEKDKTICYKIASEKNVTCSPIPRSEDVSTKCTLPQHLGSSPISDCSAQPVPAGTIAQQSCMKYYISTQPGQPNLNCQLNGNWSGSFLKCTPDCGISEPPKTGDSTNNGKIVEKGEWPWYAGIYRSKRYHFHCGGTLISPTVILTAAHCVTDVLRKKQELYVALGKLKRDYNEDENEHVQKPTIKSIIPNKDYNPSSYEADIALIILNKPVNITDFVRPVCLPKDESGITRDLDNKEGTVGGFGGDDVQKISTALKTVQLSYLEPKKCEMELKKKGQSQFRSTWVCGEHRKGDQAVCKGDSGGGFIFHSGHAYGRYFVEGVVSHGLTRSDTCNKDAPEVFTEVSAFIPWINRVLGDPFGPMIDKWYQINLKTNGLLTWSRDKGRVGNTYRIQIVYGNLLKNYDQGSKLHDDSLWKFEKSEIQDYYTLVNKNLPNAVLAWEETSTHGKDVVLIDKKAQSEADDSNEKQRGNELWKFELESSKSDFFKIYNGGFSNEDPWILSFLEKEEKVNRNEEMKKNDEEKDMNFVQIYPYQNNKTKEHKNDGDFLWSLTTSIPADNGIPETKLFTGVLYQIKLKSGGLLARSLKIDDDEGGYRLQVLRIADLSIDYMKGGKFYEDTLWKILKGKSRSYKLINKNHPNATTTWGENSPKGKWMVLVEGKGKFNFDNEDTLWNIRIEEDDDDEYYNIFNAEFQPKNGGLTISREVSERGNYAEITTGGKFKKRWRKDSDYLWTFSPDETSDA